MRQAEEWAAKVSPDFKALYSIARARDRRSQ